MHQSITFYALKDHQGNTRVTFSTTPENYTMVETFESDSPLGGGQGEVFQNLHPHTNTNANTTPGGNEVELLQSGQTGALGLLSVNKGDTVHLSVNANYETAPSGNTFLGTAFNALFGTYNSNVAGGEAASSIENEFSEALSGLGMAGKPTANSQAPKAYLNYIYFDAGMNYVSAGFQQISTAAEGVGVHETVSINDILADREGYLLVYLSNENSEAVNVHFDDLMVYHGKTNIVQANDYYPFGLSSETYTRNASLFNPYLYNQGSRLEEETEWYHTPFRKYDASIGRFTGVDALASSMASINSYHYAYNNPVNMSDPTGLYPRTTRDRGNDMNEGGGGGGFMRTLRRIAAAFGYGGGGISGYRESSGSSGTFARGGTDGQDDFMNNPFAIGTSAYANEQAAQEDISNLRRRQRDEALANLGVQFVEGTFEEVLVASSNENQQGLDGTAYSPLYKVETIFKANGGNEEANPGLGIALRTLFTIGAEEILVALGLTAAASELDRLTADETDRRWYHYTDAKGFAGILKTGTIYPGDKGKVYLADDAYAASDAFTRLFLGQQTHKDRGNYVIVFTLDRVQESNLTWDPNNPLEYTHFGSVKPVRILFEGPNPFGK